MYMFDEAIPDCVPEFYRSRQEDADHEYELLTRCQEQCRANRRKLDAAIAAGLPVLPFGGYEACWECPDADHDTAAFTLDVYGHITDQMKRESANRMQQYIDRISKRE